MNTWASRMARALVINQYFLYPRLQLPAAAARVDE
jgi:hypothetical protein